MYPIGFSDGEANLQPTQLVRHVETFFLAARLSEKPIPTRLPRYGDRPTRVQD
jgi:hypothetical protein